MWALEKIDFCKFNFLEEHAFENVCIGAYIWISENSEIIAV